MIDVLYVLIVCDVPIVIVVLNVCDVPVVIVVLNVFLVHYVLYDPHVHNVPFVLLVSTLLFKQFFYQLSLIVQTYVIFYRLMLLRYSRLVVRLRDARRPFLVSLPYMVVWLRRPYCLVPLL